MTEPKPDHHPWRNRMSGHALEIVLLCLGVVILLTLVPATIHSDGVSRYDAVRALMRGELPVLKYSLVQPLLGVPLVAIARPMGFGSRIVIEYFNIIVFVACLYPLWTRLARLFTAAMATRALLILLSASMMSYHLTHYFGELLSAMAITTAFLYARDRPVLAIVLMAIGVANSPVLVIPAGLASLMLIRYAPAALMGTVAAGLMIALELYMKYGAAWSSPYLAADERGFETVLPYSGLPGFSYPVFLGVLSVLFSFGKGLLWFIPGLVTLFDRQVIQRLGLGGTPAGRALVAFSVAIVLVYSGWWAWYGGDFWGPRFFLILALPASLGLAAATTVPASGPRLWITLTVLTLSAWVGLNGTVFEQRSMDLCWENQYALEFLCWYVPEFSALWRPFVTMTWMEMRDAIWTHPARVFAVWQILVWGVLVTSVARSAWRAR